MYSNFWKPIRSWFLITYLNSFKQHCYFSEMEYLQFPPPYLHCILSTLSALWGWSAGLGQWGIGGLEGSKILVTLCPSLGMASGWLPPSMEDHFNYYMPFFSTTTCLSPSEFYLTALSPYPLKILHCHLWFSYTLPIP